MRVGLTSQRSTPDSLSCQKYLGKMLRFKQYLKEANSKYIVAKNPSDKKWYAMGHVGKNKWMPVSSGFKNKAQAQKWAKSQDKVDSAARGEISGV